MNIAHNGMKQYLSDAIQKRGINLTPEQFLVMDTLWDEGMLSQQQIADITMRDKNSIVKLIDGLENKNLVKRVTNQNDRRQNLIQVTKYSRTIQEEVTSVALSAVAEMVKGIAEEELIAFVSIISRIEANVAPGSDLLALAQKYPTSK